MHVRTSITQLFGFYLAFGLVMLGVNSSLAAATENQHIIFEGTLTDANGSPIDLTGAPLVFYISSGSCYLYGESSSIAGDSSGNIIHRIGTGSVVAGSPNSYSHSLFFGNVSGTTTFSGSNCSVATTDTREARVFYSAGNITALLKLGSVPYAHNATMLNGKSASDFLSVTADSNTLFNSGTSGQYLTKTATGLAWNNLNLTAAQVTTALGYSPSSGSVSVTSSSVISALGYTPTDASAMIPISNLPGFSGDVSTSSGSSVTTLQRLRGVNLSATAPVSGQVLFYNGVEWTPMMPIIPMINLANGVFNTLPVANGGSPFVSTPNGFYLTSNTAFGTASVPTSIRLYAEASTLGQAARFVNTFASGGHGVRIDVLNNNANYYGLNVNNNLGSMFMVQNDGRVGFGTMTPEAHVHIAALTPGFPALKIASSPLVASPPRGAVEYDGQRLFLTDDTGLRQTIPMGSTSSAIDNISEINSSGDITLNSPGSIFLNADPSFGVIQANRRMEVYNNTNGESMRYAATGNQYVSFYNSGNLRGMFGHGSNGYFGSGYIADYFGIYGQTGFQLTTNNGALITGTSSQKVGINTNAPAYTLDVAGDLRITGTAYTNSGSSNFTVISDRRLKDISGSFDKGLGQITNLETYKFYYKKDNPKGLDSNHEITGVMAQDVQKVIPEAVVEGQDGFLTLNTSPIFFAMINAIKELYHDYVGVKADLAAKDEKIQKLESENAAQAQELKDVKARLERIERAISSEK